MLYTLEQQEAMGASVSVGRVQQQLIKEEDSTSPTFFTGLESTSPNVSNSKQNGGKKMRKS